MKIGAAAVILLITLLSGCTIKKVNATDYDNDYVYAIRNSPNAPNWDDITYPGYTWGSYPWYGSQRGL